MLAKVDNKRGMVPKNYVVLVGSQPNKINPADIERVKNGQSDVTIGSGGFADVLRAVYRGEPVALKVPRSSRQKTPTKIRETLEREALILSRLDHKNIVGFHGLSLDPLFLVLELCEGGTLFSLCRKLSSSDPLTTIYWAKQVASAMDHLHSREDPLVHADLKADNGELKSF
jgi:serine/threonine protein kinase